jgi:hypothetical protein
LKIKTKIIILNCEISYFSNRIKKKIKFKTTTTKMC